MSALRALREKYGEMQRLRRAHDAGADEAPEATKASLRALAQRFPGVLREIDRIPMKQIEVRIAELDIVVGTPDAAVPEWALWSVTYHGIVRAALRVKRLSSGTSTPADALARVRERYVADDDEPALEWFDLDRLGHLLRPPRGRLSAWVLVQVAHAHNATVDQVTRALYF